MSLSILRLLWRVACSLVDDVDRSCVEGVGSVAAGNLKLGQCAGESNAAIYIVNSSRCPSLAEVSSPNPSIAGNILEYNFPIVNITGVWSSIINCESSRLLLNSIASHGIERPRGSIIPCSHESAGSAKAEPQKRSTRKRNTIQKYRDSLDPAWKAGEIH